MIRLIYGILCAYVLGSFPSSYVAGKLNGVDITKKGSRNAGATNVLRVIGRIPALAVLVTDVAKGAFAVTYLADFFYIETGAIPLGVYQVLIGITVVSGHIWSVFLKMKGGKGVATACGVLAMLLPRVFVIGLLVFMTVLWFSKFVSLSSLCMMITIPIIAVIAGRDISLILFSVALCLIISYKHKGNIRRLILGTENPIGGKTKS